MTLFRVFGLKLAVKLRNNGWLGPLQYQNATEAANSVTMVR